ncbi:MAG: DUF1697 domain-containing protein [Dokdonella sp.]
MSNKQHLPFVAFFRNLNLGRRNRPTRQQFKAAFIEAGATAAASFLTNGTIAFQARGIGDARDVLARACDLLEGACGLDEPAFLRRLSHLQALVRAEPFAAIDRGSIDDCYITLLHDDAVLPEHLPRASRSNDVEIIHLTAAEAMCVSRRFSNTPGSPNAFLEKMLELPATTRAWNTVVRLVAKYS